MKRRQYDNSTTVENEALILQSFQKNSEKAYQKHSVIRNISYDSETPRSSTIQSRFTYDFFPLEKPLGTVIFIHGGYWQWCEKEDFAFIAEHILPKNFQLILLEYPLTPHVTLTEINQAIQTALDHLQTVLLQGHPVYFIGHSAGAHLVALNHQHSLNHGSFLLSGIYDLEPIAQTHLNEALSLTHEEILNLSPITNINPENHSRSPCHIFVGKQELPELIQQSQSFYQVLNCHSPSNQKSSNNISLSLFPNINHYTILAHFFKNFPYKSL